MRLRGYFVLVRYIVMKTRTTSPPRRMTAQPGNPPCIMALGVVRAIIEGLLTTVRCISTTGGVEVPTSLEILEDILYHFPVFGRRIVSLMGDLSNDIRNFQTRHASYPEMSAHCFLVRSLERFFPAFSPFVDSKFMRATDLSRSCKTAPAIHQRISTDKSSNKLASRPSRMDTHWGKTNIRASCPEAFIQMETKLLNVIQLANNDQIIGTRSNNYIQLPATSLR